MKTTLRIMMVMEIGRIIIPNVLDAEYTMHTLNGLKLSTSNLSNISS